MYYIAVVIFYLSNALIMNEEKRKKNNNKTLDYFFDHWGGDGGAGIEQAASNILQKMYIIVLYIYTYIPNTWVEASIWYWKAYMKHFFHIIYTRTLKKENIITEQRLNKWKQYTIAYELFLLLLLLDCCQCSSSKL